MNLEPVMKNMRSVELYLEKLTKTFCRGTGRADVIETWHAQHAHLFYLLVYLVSR